MDIKSKLTKIIYENLEQPAVIDEAMIRGLITVPPEEKLGDFALPCFRLAPKGTKPVDFAAALREKILANASDSVLFSEIRAVGPYLNFFLNRSEVSSDVLSEVFEKGENFGRSDLGEGKTVVLDFSSPNIAKPFHIGHLCSTAIGSSLSRIYDFLGYKTENVNHIGDWGTQFGKLISAYRLWGDKETIEKDPINELLKIYVKFHQEAKENPALEDEARHNFNLLENGDKDVTDLWKFFVEASLKEFNRMYDLLDIHFDSYAGESFYSDKMDEVVEILTEKNLLEDSEGAKVIRFDEKSNMPPCIIIKSDGSTIYATRDIAAALYRHRHYNFDKCIYVVGTPQSLHFQQVFAILGMMGYDWNTKCEHVGFGYVRFPDRALSTRNGDVVLLEDVLNESINKTYEIIKGNIENNTTTVTMEELPEVAQKIGVGAILFDFLKNGRERDIIFDLNRVLDFEGESGPYVQYSYARGKSVLRRAEVAYDNADFGLLTSDEEYSMIKCINKLTDVVIDAANKNEPYIVTRYAIELAKTFNKFYNSCNIMKSEPELMKARLALTSASCEVIKIALNLIGVKVVEKM